VVSLVTEPLEPALFAPFGTVIAFAPEIARIVNQGTAHRADTRALLDHAGDATPVLAIYRVQPQSRPLRLTLFERHPRSAQSFVSISVPRFLVVVAPAGPDGLPVAAEARAFVGRAGSGLSYRRDQWHTPIMALGAGGDLLMLIAEAGTADDCVEHRFDTPFILQDPNSSESMTYGA
jgi:ureidoglycolate lyase